MCSMYWNLNTEVVCPKCGNKSVWNLQTHFMGENMSCLNFYKIGDDVAELKGVSVILHGDNNSFCGDCPECAIDPNDKDWVCYDFGAEIIDGKVIKVWLLSEVSK